MSNAQFVLLFIMIVNALTFIVYGVDKYRAKKNLSRVPEWQLIVFALIGGSVGAWSSMYFFRHKTKHLKFVIGVPLIFLAQFLVVIYVLN